MKGKKLKESKSLVDTSKVYTPTEAMELVKKTSRVAFDATVELHLRLGIDPKKGEQQVRGTITYPHGTGKTKRVAAFVSGDREREAREAGAHLVGGEELIAEIGSKEKIDFDVAVATPDMMPKLAKIAKILGPKGLMPNPKTDTVGTNVKKMVEEIARGKASFKNDDTGNVHLAIGKVSFEAQTLLDNFNAALEVLKRVKPASSKGIYIKNAVLTSSMGPAIRVAV